ncbi:MAG: glycosyltransferase family 2 protein [Candidatus Brocadiales bacterium]|nr:glycosyltransferase family 2 protein [Candidatus Brocadiales bacterium]
MGIKKDKVSIIIPVYYNRESLEELYARLCRVSEANSSMKMEIVFVDDDSRDGSFDVIRSIASRDSRVLGIKLSRNYGSFVACLAGLTRCAGDCAVIISADLQDPPELISEMYKKWQEGNKIVMAVRNRRQEGFLKVLFARVYYMMFRLLITKDMPKGGFDFVLIDRQVVDVLTAIQEKNTTLMGLILWTGFSRAEVPYTRMERKYGESKWTLSKKVNYFLDSMMAFSKLPIRIFFVMGVALSLLSLLGIAYVVIAVLMGWITLPGWPSLMIVNLFMFSVLFLAIWMLGEYIWRNLEEARKRPLFLIDSEYKRTSVHEKIEETP